MTRPIQPATDDQARCLRNAIGALKLARGYLKAANSPRTLARLDATLRSAGGAERHMNHRLRRSRAAA
jgi:hypothetical protein